MLLKSLRTKNGAPALCVHAYRVSSLLKSVCLSVNGRKAELMGLRIQEAMARLKSGTPVHAYTRE